jgi:hypothetical protein
MNSHTVHCTEVLPASGSQRAVSNAMALGTMRCVRPAETGPAIGQGSELGNQALSSSEALQLRREKLTF